MSTWDECGRPNETCSQCGAKYKVTFKNLPIKDKDNFICNCGHVLREWKTTGMYMYEPINKES